MGATPLVREAVDLDRGLTSAVGRSLDLIAVNACYPERFSDEEADALEAAARRHSSSWAIRAALAEHRRARSHAQQVGWLRGQATAPVVTLPFLFVPELGPAGFGQLARELG